jgi:hypothetical protein
MATTWFATRSSAFLVSGCAFLRFRNESLSSFGKMMRSKSGEESTCCGMEIRSWFRGGWFGSIRMALLVPFRFVSMSLVHGVPREASGPKSAARWGERPSEAPSTGGEPSTWRLSQAIIAGFSLHVHPAVTFLSGHASRGYVAECRKDSNGEIFFPKKTLDSLHSRDSRVSREEPSITEWSVRVQNSKKCTVHVLVLVPIISTP